MSWRSAARFAVLTPGAELGGHDPGEMHDLERVLEHVLSVARPEAQPPEDRDELLAELAAVRLEDGLGACLVDLLVELGLREVVHLLDACRVDPAVLHQLLERELRDLPPDAVERRENDRVRCVVDDEVDAGQVLQGPDVATLPSDDATLHVVTGELHDRHGRLRGVTRRDPLQRVRDERSRPTACLCASLFLHLPDRPLELVTNEVQ